MPNRETIRFGLYVADLHAAELRKGQDRVPLQNLPFRILALLLREPGRVVTREELRQQLWPADTFVDFERGISTAVSKLREALGDSATNPRFVETVGRKGYRFIAPVSPAAPRAPQEQRAIGASAAAGTDRATVALPPVDTLREPVLPADLPVRDRHSRRKRLIYSLVAAVAMASAIAIFKFWPRQTPPAAGQPEIKSIAVLPLQNLSGDPQQDYLSDGLTEAVTTMLAQIGDLRVISRTTAMHYKHVEKTTPEIAKELGVDALVEGSVVRSGNHLRLTVQLVQTKNDRHIWANSYDRELEDVVSLEGELSREIAGQIRIRLTPEQMERFAQKRPVDPEAYALYLQGRYYWHQRNEESLTKSIGYFEQAIARDPKFAPAYAGLADTYLVMPFFGPSPDREVYERAGAAAEKGLALDPRSGEARNSEACVKLYRDWDFKGAEQEFQQALTLNPNYATAHQWYAELLTMEGRYQEAIAEINRGLQLDSQSPVMHLQAGQVLNAARHHTDAIAEYKKSLELDPNLFGNYFGMYMAYRRMGDFDHAIPIGAIHARYMGKRYQKAFTEAAHVFATQGKEAFLRKSLGLWAKAPYWDSPVGQVWDYGELHEYNKCLEVLEREYQRHNLLVTYALDPELDGLRPDPRYQKFLHKIGVR